MSTRELETLIVDLTAMADGWTKAAMAGRLHPSYAAAAARLKHLLTLPQGTDTAATTEAPVPTVRPTRYEVSVLSEDDVNHRLYAITVEDRGAGRWAICWMGDCLSPDGTWSREPRPSDRDDDWLDAHRFDLSAALRALAHNHARQESTDV